MCLTTYAGGWSFTDPERMLPFGLFAPYGDFGGIFLKIFLRVFMTTVSLVNSSRNTHKLFVLFTFIYLIINTVPVKKCSFMKLQKFICNNNNLVKIKMEKFERDRSIVH